MYRPYIVCHMVTSIDGKVTDEFLNRPECEAATEIYYEMNREYKAQGSGGFICGRVTMEGSFTGGWYPDLSKYKPVEKCLGHYMNCWFDDVADAKYFAIAFDLKGKLGWRSNIIEDSDPGYGGAMIIEVLTEQVDSRYLASKVSTRCSPSTLPRVCAVGNSLLFNGRTLTLKKVHSR